MNDTGSRPARATRRFFPARPLTNRNNIVERRRLEQPAARRAVLRPTRNYPDARTRLNESPWNLPAYAYFHVVRLWLTRPLNRHQKRHLRAFCRKVKIFDWRCLFAPQFCQRITLYQPQREALELLATLDGTILVNYVECALDLIVPADSDVDPSLDYIRNTVLLSHHTGVAKRYVSGFTSRQLPEGQRRAGSWYHAYSAPCKLTGEIPCIHLETMHQSARHVRRIGIHQAGDLVDFDFARHFAGLRLFELDLERLGRYDSNQRAGSRRQKPRFDSAGNNLDTLRGTRLYNDRALDDDGEYLSLQTFIQRYGRGPFLRPLTPYSIDIHSADS
jgi:hypothetical protein